MKENIYKPIIRVDGITDIYKVKWRKLQVIPEIDEHGLIHFIIITKDNRINLWENSIPAVEKFAKSRVETKGRGAVTNGKVHIVVRDVQTKQEHIIAVVEKERRKTYTIIDKPEKRKKL